MVNYNYPVLLEQFNGTDAFVGSTVGNRLGYDGNMSLDNILLVASLYQARVVTKHGSGKWYLKGVGVTRLQIMNQMEKYKSKKRYRTCQCNMLTY